MALQQPFTTTSPTLVNFDFTDRLAGNSYITFYPTIANTGSEIYYLSRQVMDSQDNNIEVQGTATTTYDFDTTFDVAAIIKGNAYFNYSTASGGGSTITVTVTVYHVDSGATETSLGSASSPARAGGVIARENIKIALTEKNFAVGETLRFEISIGHVGANPSKLYADPSSINSLTETVSTPNRSIGTDFVSKIPFIKTT